MRVSSGLEVGIMDTDKKQFTSIIIKHKDLDLSVLKTLIAQIVRAASSASAKKALSVMDTTDVEI